jgi:hypothetical protein
MDAFALQLSTAGGIIAANQMAIAAFKRGGTEDLQSNSQFSIPAGGFSGAFTDAASFYLGYAIAKSGLSLYIDKQIGLTDSLARALGSPHGGNHALPVRFASARKAAAIHTCTSKVEVGSRETAGRHTQQRDRIVPI